MLLQTFYCVYLCVCRIPNCGTLVQVQRRRNEREERRKCIKCIRCRHYKVIRVCSRVSPKTHPLNFLYVIMYVSLSFIVSLLAPPPRSFFFHPDIGFRTWRHHPRLSLKPTHMGVLTIIGREHQNKYIHSKDIRFRAHISNTRGDHFWQLQNKSCLLYASPRPRE